MVRTTSEDPCMKCGRKTNYYDALRGRLCPRCGATITFVKTNYEGTTIFPFETVTDIDEEIAKQPLIDHSYDIEAHLQRK